MISIAYPLAFLLLLPAVAAVVWLRSQPAGGAARLPGDWARLVERPLRAFMARGALVVSPLGSVLLLAIWVLLVLSLSRPAIETGNAASYSNIAGRVIAIDLGGGADLHRQRLAVRELVAAMPDVPTALVVATGDSFDAVPLTTDRDFIERYLNVIKPDVMPLAGRSLSTALAHGEGVLTRAGVAAGQLVLLSGGVPPQAARIGPARWQWAILVAEEELEAWADYADAADARLSRIDDLGDVDGDLEDAIARVSRKGDLSARFELAPVFAAAALLLWLGLFRRRRTT